MHIVNLLSVLLLSLSIFLLASNFRAYYPYRKRKALVRQCLAFNAVAFGVCLLGLVAYMLPEGMALTVVVQVLSIASMLLNIQLVRVMYGIYSRADSPTSKRLRALYLLPLVALLVVAVDPMDNLYVAQVTKVPGQIGYALVMNSMGTILMGLSSLALCFSFVLAYWASRTSPIQSNKLMIITFLSVLIPSAINALDLYLETAFNLHIHIGLSAFWLPITIICNGHFSYLRTAHSHAIQAMEETYVLFDKYGVLMDENQAAKTFFQQALGDQTPSRENFLRVIGLEESAARLDDAHEFLLDIDGTTMYYTVSMFPVNDGISQHCGDGYILREITTYREQVNHYNSLAINDPLTGAKNRRYLTDMAAEALPRAAVAGQPVTALMLDIDLFKNVNDTHGHMVGDEVLRGLSQRLMQHLRKSDTLFRYGGEEFLILSENTDGLAGRAIADRLLEAVRENPFPTEAGALPITISIGGCTRHAREGDSIEQWIAQADQKLYQAKANGRNRVEYAANDA